MDAQRYEIEIEILPEDIDQMGHVNNVVYLRWVQDAAAAHWRCAAPMEDRANLLWIVLRHEIDYRRPAVTGDELTASTWVGKASRLSFDRFTEIRRASDGVLVARARTVWCPIDRQTGRPTEVSKTVRALFSTEEQQ